MTEVEKRILLNQREIMYALKYVVMNRPIDIGIANGLGYACQLTNNILTNNEEVNEDGR